MNAPPIRDDEQLIELFLDGAPDEADSAFAVLVTRYEPVVMSLCRRVLNRREDAEDASQATFVSLLRNAAKIRNRRVLGSWLCGVAYRVAIRMKAQSARRREVHSQAGYRVPPGRVEDAAAFGELRQILHDAVDHLPEEFRTLVVLSYLEGKSNEEVARFLGCPIGTVKGRLWRAREMLRKRLLRRWHGAANGSETSEVRHLMTRSGQVKATTGRRAGRKVRHPRRVLLRPDLPPGSGSGQGHGVESGGGHHGGQGPAGTHRPSVLMRNDPCVASAS